MAWARPPGAPQLPSCPLEALEPRENEYVPLIDHLLPYIGGATGVAAMVAYNYMNRRPFYSGLWRHFAFGTSFAYAGYIFRELRREAAYDKDEVLRQYIKLHPEDFPPYKRTLLKDMLEPWHPVR